MKSKARLFLILAVCCAPACLFSCASSPSAAVSSSSSSLTSISISGENRVCIGSTIQLLANVYGPSSKVTWSISTAQVSLATIDQDGRLTGLKAGFATVYATSDEKDESGTNYYGSYTVYIEPTYVESWIASLGSLDVPSGAGIDFSMSLSTPQGEASASLKIDLIGDPSLFLHGRYDASFQLAGSLEYDFFSSKGSFNFYYLGDFAFALFTLNSSSQVSSYKEIDFKEIAYKAYTGLQSNLSSLSGFLPSLFSLASYGIQVSNTAGLLLNAWINYGSEEEGMCLSSTGLSVLNGIYSGDGLRQSIIDAAGESSSLSILLPVSFSQISLKPAKNASNQITGAIFSVEATPSILSSLSGSSSSFFTLSASLNSTRTVNSGTFNALASLVKQAQKDAANATNLQEKKEALEKLKEYYGNDIYNLTSLSSSYKELSSDYIKTLKDDLSTAVYPDLFALYAADVKNYQDYLSFKAYYENFLLVSGQTSIKAGQAISIQSPALINPSVSDASLPSYVISAVSSQDLSSYIAIDSSLNQLTVLKNSEAGDLKVSVSLAAEGYNQVPFVFTI